MTVFLLIEHHPYGDGDDVRGVFDDLEKARQAGVAMIDAITPEPLERDWNTRDGGTLDRLVSKRGGASSMHIFHIQSWDVR